VTAASPSRRDFLRAGAAITGGLVIGFVLPGCHAPDAATAHRADEKREFAPNAWLRITPDDHVVFVLDRVEMGQGTMTSHCTLLAEELEIDPARIEVRLAPSHRSYDNPDAQLGFQITGGSSSVRTSWTPLRAAGATAREMLRAAGAESFGAPIEECKAENGTIVHAPSGRRSTYGKLCLAAAHQPMTTPALKPTSQFQRIGKDAVRLDARMKVDGTGIFGIDVERPGLLTAVIVRSPTLGGTVKRFDARAAKALPGIVDVFEVPSGVAVVASRYWQARAAASKVEVTWDAGPLAGLDSAWIWKTYEARAKTPGDKIRAEGDFAAAYARGAKTVEATYRVPYLAHATMEPMNATAHVTDDRCDIWAPTQSPGLAVEEAHRLTGLPREAIQVNGTLLGGGFGRRLEQDYVADAVNVSMRLKRPVKVVWSREDDMTNDAYRPMTHNVLRGAVDEKGEISAWFHHIVAQSIVSRVGEKWASAILPSGMPGPLKGLLARTAASMYGRGLTVDASSVEGASDFAYAMPNLRVEYTRVDPQVPVGFWRGVGSSENVFISESFLDELAHAGGKDPYQLRRALLKDAPRNLRVLDLAAKQAGWGTPTAPGIGRGIAQAQCFGSYAAHVAEVSVTGHEVRVHRVVCAVDCGLVVNPDLVRCQVESAIVFGLSAALKQRITFARGRVEQTNFHQFQALRMHEMPKIEVHIVPSDEPPSGIGEPGLPPLAPAVTNAIFAATGRRIRELPIERALEEKA
jgi:CO/xanthine dehydrogenase Mo-binding subunit